MNRSKLLSTLALAAMALQAHPMLAEPLPHPGSQLGLKLRASALPGRDQPFDIVATDLNRDRRIDLATTNANAAAVAIYLGRGDGTFDGPTDVATGFASRGLVAVDFNGDGIPDLCVAATQDHAIFFHAGHGDGTFAAPRRFPVGERPFLATAADFNADGHLDVAVANEGAKVSVLLGSGKGDFSVASYVTDKWPSAVAAGDFDEDGHLDMAVTNWGANNVSLLFGKGDGTFSAPRNITYEGHPWEHHSLYCVRTADLDRDGHLDMIWNDMIQHAAYLRYGNGRGEFPRTAVVLAAPGVRSIVAVDLNGDNWLDLASANTAANSTSIMLADGKGGFLPTQQVPVGTHPRMVTAADLNGDQRPDLVVTNLKSGDITILLNEGVTQIDIPTPDIEAERKSRPVLTGLNAPADVALTPSGDILVADQRHHRIARVERASGRFVTFAGTGESGDEGDGGPASDAKLNGPAGLAVGADGSIYIADTGNSRVRKIDPNGIITTIAGTGKPGYSGDSGPAARAEISNPMSLAVDASGAVYVADIGNIRVRRIDAAGIISPVAGTGTPGSSGDGGPSTSAAIGIGVRLTLDASGELLITDSFNKRIRRVDRRGVISTVAGGGASPADIGQPTAAAVDAAGTIYFSDQTGQAIRKLSPSGSVETLVDLRQARGGLRSSPSGLALDRSGNLFFADPSDNCVRRVDPSGRLTTVAGAPEEPVRPAATAPPADVSTEESSRQQLQLDWEFGFRSGSDANAPYGVAATPDGSIYVAGDVGGGADWKVLRLTAGGQQVWSFDIATGGFELPAALTVTADGQVVAAGHRIDPRSDNRRDYLVVSLSHEGRENWRYSPTAPGDQFTGGIASDSASNLYVAAESAHGWEVFSLNPKGVLRWTYNDKPGAARAIAVDRGGNLLVAGNDAKGWRIVKLRPDGTLVWEHRRVAALPSQANGIAVDASGSAIVTGTWNDGGKQLRVEKLDPDGHSVWAYVDPEPATIGNAITVDADGNCIAVGETAVDWIMLSLAPDGKRRWRFNHDGGGGGKNPDQAFAVAMHPAGGFIVTGLVHPLPPEFPSRGAVDWRVARYRVFGE